MRHDDRTRTEESSVAGAGGHDMFIRVDTEGFPLGKISFMSSKLEVELFSIRSGCGLIRSMIEYSHATLFP